MMEQFVQIDGSLFEGGGQMIRSSLALGTILKKQFNMHSIRKNRPNPGINNQLRSVFSAFIPKSPAVGQTQIHIYPQFQKPKHIKASTAASITLMLQCFTPICAALGYNIPIKIQGGTDVSRSPCVESIKLGLIPLLQKMGVKFQILDIKKGFYPTGHGYLQVKIDTEEQFIKPIQFVNFEPPTKVVISYYLKSDKLPAQAKQFSRNVKNLLANTFPNQKIDYQLKVQRVFKTKDNYGIGCMVFGDKCVWDVGTVGQAVQQETILDRLRSYCQRRVCLDEHHQDQLLLLASLANGVSRLNVGNQLSLHTQSLLYIIQSFIPHFQHKLENGILELHGIGFKIKKQKNQESEDSNQ